MNRGDQALALFNSMNERHQQAVIECGIVMLDILVSNDISIQEIYQMVEARNIAKEKIQ